MVGRGLGDDCDYETVARSAYLSERIYLEEGDGYDTVGKILLEEAEEWNDNDNYESLERQLRGVERSLDLC